MGLESRKVKKSYLFLFKKDIILLNWLTTVHKCEGVNNLETAKVWDYSQLMLGMCSGSGLMLLLSCKSDFESSKNKINKKLKSTCNFSPLHFNICWFFKSQLQPTLHFWTTGNTSSSPIALNLWYAFFLLPRQWSPWGQGPHLLQSCVCCIDQHSVWHVVYSKWFRYEPSEGQKLNPACGRLTFVRTFNN